MNKIVVALLCISILCNLYLLQLVYQDSRTVQDVEATAALEKKYSFLSEQSVDEKPKDLLLNFLVLRKQLREQVAPYGDTFGLYFEYLPTGTSININGNNEFYAASLFKVPVIMAYYKGKERMQTSEDPVLEVKQDHIDNQFGSLWKKGVGATLKASEAIRLALEDSDNTAIKALIPYVQDEDFNTVYNGLDITLNSDHNGALISAKNYSSILKALYYSSILSRDNSQDILTMLTRSPFSDKLVAGVKEGIPVAHKIGDFRTDGQEGYRDCGIVYEPRRPYLLCMVSTSNEVIARERMSAVSRTIYTYISNK